MGDGVSVEGISILLGKWLVKDHTKLPILASADDDGGDDNTSEDDDGKWSYCQIAKEWGCIIGCKNPLCAIKWLHMSCLRIKESQELIVAILQVYNGKQSKSI